MAKKKVCKKCKIFVETGNCPICKNANFASSWQGRVSIVHPEKSEIGKIMGYNTRGDYVIKVR